MYREAQVRAGMALLDDKAPGWENKLDLGALHLDSATRCVLGQLYGDYASGLYELGVETLPAFLGFSSGGVGVQERYAYDSGEALTQTWRELIIQRRQEHSQPERELVTA